MEKTPKHVKKKNLYRQLTNDAKGVLYFSSDKINKSLLN